MSRLRGQKISCSKLNFTEDPPCMGPVVGLIILSGQTSSCWCGVEVWRGWCRLRCRPRHVTAVQNSHRVASQRAIDKTKLLLILCTNVTKFAYYFNMGMLEGWILAVN
ncbi:hypothetical protein AVEN_196575-1 [Araneus ventricosus]|uniref:Uncharacterized protein n=1 Tax=Araneus ventricosus TaxID=182803 RepID=A0A4Y2WB75_ARAVE|nr:hypothetical protein AVEN_196575-1 [Araneus ventricosus]